MIRTWLNKKPNGCVGCPLYDDGYGFVKSEGQGLNRVLVLAEAPSKSDVQDGLPLRPFSEAGVIFERMLKRAGIDRNHFIINNTISCRPPDDIIKGTPHQASATAQCSQYINELITTYKPKVILTLGDVALAAQTIYGGEKQDVTRVRGYILNSKNYKDINVVPTYNPLYIQRGHKNLFNVFIHDVKRAIALANGWTPPELKRNWVLAPSFEQAEHYLKGLKQFPEALISYDIETSWGSSIAEESDATDTSTHITQIQFSTAPEEAICFPWASPYKEIATEILQLPNPKCHWNGFGYDEPVLIKNGVTPQGESIDLMMAWHHLQPDLPRGLQYVTSFYAPELSPWKHMAHSNPEEYGCFDVDSLQRINALIWDDLRAKGLYDSYQTYVHKFTPILRRMTTRGIPIDPTIREAFSEKLVNTAQETLATLQPLVPNEVRSKRIYVGTPKVTEDCVREIHSVLDFPTIPCTKCQETGKETNAKGREIKCKTCKGKGAYRGKEKIYLDKEVWVRYLPFNPDSSSQLINYMRHKGHKIPIGLKTGKETSDKVALQKLHQKTKDPVYKLTRDYREVLDMKGTFIDGWEVDENNRVHSTFTTNPATGQLSAKAPNVLNPPKHGQFAKEWRKQVAVAEDEWLVEADLTAAHALTLGFEAGCHEYMRLARLDIHSYVAGHLLKLPNVHKWLALDDKELFDLLNEVKQEHKVVRNTKAKPAILGYGFGLGAHKLWKMNEESFKSRNEAGQLLTLIDKTFPKVRDYRINIREIAHQHGFLQSKHGFMRYFSDVKYYDSVYERWSYGKDSEAAIAFLPANDAFGHMRLIMLNMEEQGLNERYQLINTVHDSLIFIIKNRDLDVAMETIASIMEAPSTVLKSPIVPNGLKFGIEISVGKNWGELEDVYKTPLEKLN